MTSERSSPGRLRDWLELLEARHPKSIDLGLDRCGEVFRAMGSPRPAPRVITIAGTNGKGSVAAYLAGMLQAAGASCGAYTSPHILRFNERIAINGVCATDDDIVRAFEAVEAARRGVSLTYFEFSTLAAFLLMREALVEAAVLEVGLGGRLDAVNLVDADCAVITAIGLDHQDFLGDDRETIGREKAGIMRGGTPAICGDADPPRSVLQAASALGAPLERIGKDFAVRDMADWLEIRLAEGPVRVPKPALPGVHQAANLATAVAALNRVFPDLARNEESLAKGVSGTRLRGRLERHAADSRILLDVGHNPQAAGVVARYLSESRRGRCICVLAMLADKQAEAVADRLAGVVDTWICAGLEGPRGQTGKSLAARIAGATAPGRAWVARDVPGALDRARGIAGKRDTILVFGSFETVAATLRHLG